MSKTQQAQQAVKSGLMIIIFTLGSKFLGFVREILIAAKFGSGVETDAYFIAMAAIGLLAGVISNAISTTFIPVLSEIEVKQGKQAKMVHTNNMINIVFFVSVVLVILGFLLSPFMVKLLARGFNGEQLNLAVRLTRMGLPMIIISGIIGSLRALLQSSQRHTSSAAIGIPSNIVYIFFLIFLSSIFGIKGLMYTAVVATLSQLSIQFLETRSIGYKYKPIINFKDVYIKKVLYLSVPVFIGVAINDLNAIVDRTLASTLMHGSISALNYADRLNNLILGVFITSITTVIFPILSKESNTDNIEGMKEIIRYGINLILLITVPATIGLMILAKPIVEIAFQRGQFDEIATIMTYQALIYYSVGLISMSVNLLMTRVYYSLQDTKSPLIYGVISVGVNIVGNIILVNFMGHSGLALSTSLANIIVTLLMIYGLKIKIGSLGIISYIRYGIKTGSASVFMGLVVYIIYNSLYSQLGTGKLYNIISLMVSVGLGLLVYVILCYVFNIDEIKLIISKLHSMLIKLRSAIK